MFDLAVKDDFTTEYSLFKDNNSGFLTDRTCGFLTDSVISEVSSYVVEPCIQMSQIDEKKEQEHQ